MAAFMGSAPVSAIETDPAIVSEPYTPQLRLVA
jgi:hypothetical protein